MHQLNEQMVCTRLKVSSLVQSVVILSSRYFRTSYAILVIFLLILVTCVVDYVLMW